MVTPIKVLIFNDLHKYFNTYFADYQQVNHKLNELLLLNDLLKKEIINIEDDEDDYGYRSNYYENDYKSASDNEYYNDNLDFDQQDQEFWENF